MSATLEDASRNGMVTIGYGMYPSKNSKEAKEMTTAFLNYLSNKNTMKGKNTTMIKRKSYAPRLKLDAGRMF